MATEALVSNYWIASNAIYLQLNAMGDGNYIQGNAATNAYMLCYMRGIEGLGYDNAHNYQRWPLTVFPSVFPDDNKRYVYAAIPRHTTAGNESALICFPSARIDIYGVAINDENGYSAGEQIGSEDFYYIFLQGVISANKPSDANAYQRDWESFIETGTLASDESDVVGGDSTWWRYNPISETVTFLKQIANAEFLDAIIKKLTMDGGALNGIATDDTPASSTEKIVTPHYMEMFGVKHFLRKDVDDVVTGQITFEKVQKFLKGLQVGNFSNMAGGDWSMDEKSRSHLITDYLEVRMKAIFEELVIKKTSTIGGKEIISPAGSNVAHKVEEVTVTYNGVSQKAYRCYFLAEQGDDAIDNDWKIGDQARSESFNLKTGNYHKAGNHFLWRLVIGRDEQPVELEGKKYHYIDLSSLDYATSSDVPMPGDVLNQCGNRTDIERQNCLVFSAVDTYAPSISLYHGINSYSYDGKEYIEYGVVKSTGKAFFHVYGDAYIGDRPTAANNYEGGSYIKYDSDKNSVSIKAEISAKSTFDGKTLDKYIESKTVDEAAITNIINNSQVINDLQNQIDGAIETWFYDGVPTLSNSPANDWNTDKDKNTHLGDLYYDNKTGKAYRFAKEGSAYKWNIITDTDLTKALENSKKALDDAAAADDKADNAQSAADKAQTSADGAQKIANSKRRIFGSQPVPPYDVNDMWANAFYPTDGSTYKNDLLRCTTAKAAGATFDISDWTLASNYTDDTVANEAKKVAEEAQKNIKTTQDNLKTLDGTVTNNKTAFDNYIADGYIEPSEIVAMAQDSKRLEDAFTAATKAYDEVRTSKALLDSDGKDTKYKTDLVKAYDVLDKAKASLLLYLSTIVDEYNKTDEQGKKAIYAAVATEYSNFQSAYTAFYNALGVANNYILSTMYDGLQNNITNMAGLDYIKAALLDGKTTEINGGLILSTLIALRNSNGEVTSGINGADTKEDGIALWLGGKMIDRQASTTTENEKTEAAKSLLRFDGTGYFANGNLWWDADGRIHADPTSFIISEKNLGVYLALFEPTWKPGSTGTNVKDILSLTPCAPFKGLNVAGNVNITDGYLKIGGAYLVWDATKKMLMLSADAEGKQALDVFATGGISAYGSSTSAGGGGLTGSVLSYEKAIALASNASESTQIASAWSIKKLSDKIEEISSSAITSVAWADITDKPTSFTPSVHSHTFASLTAKPATLAGYGITDAKIANGTITLGGSSITPVTSLVDYYKKTEVDDSLKKLAYLTTASFSSHGIVRLSGKNLDDILLDFSHEHSFSELLDKPNTLDGYGIENIELAEDRHISLGGIRLSYDSNYKAWRLEGSLYATGGISAYGEGSVSGSGGLNGSVLEYSKAIMESSDSTMKLATAYSIAKLKSMIDAIDGSALTEVGWSVIKNKPTSLSGYGITDGVNAVTVSGSGNAVTAANVSGHTLTLTKGATYLTSHQTLDHLISVDKRSSALSPTTYDRGVYPVFMANSTDGLDDGGTYHGILHWRSYGVGTDLSGGNPIEIAYTANGRLWTRIASSSTAWGSWKKIAQTSDIPTTLPASDVYAWAKAATKPSYSWSEIGSRPTKLTDFTNNLSYISSVSVSEYGKLIFKGSNFTDTVIDLSHEHSFSEIIDKPNTLDGYGIENVVLGDDRYISLGGLKLSYDAKNSAWKLDGNFYATGGLSAYGSGSISGSGGLNGTVLAYSKAILEKSEDSTKVASAYSIASLKNQIDNAAGRISTLEGGSATTIEVTGTGNAITSASKSATKITFTKGANFLTSHQSLADYAKQSWVNSRLFSRETVDANNVLGTGLHVYESANGSNMPTSNTWHQVVSWGTADTNYVFQMANKYSSEGGLYIRQKIGGTWKSWRKLVEPSDLPTKLSQFTDDVVSGTYLKLAGGTMSGVLSLKANQYQDAFDGALNMNNSDIYGLNSIYTADKSDSQAEGIHFWRDSTHVDTLRMTDGKLLFAPNRALGGTATEYTVIHSGIIGDQSVKYATTAGTAKASDVYAWAKASTKPSYTWSEIGSRPTKLSQFANDLAYVASLSLSSYGILLATGRDGSQTLLDLNHEHSFSELLDKPNTLDGYGIENVVLSSDRYISLGGQKLSYDSTNKAWRLEGSLYATGGITAYGVGSGSSGGSGVFTVKKFADAKLLNSENLSEVASAYSVSALNTRLANVETGSAMSVVTNGSGNAVTSISQSGTTITATKGSTFLTSHQSLANYVTLNGSQTISALKTFSLGSFGALVIQRTDDSNGASIQFRGKSAVYGYIGFNNANKDKQLQRWNVATTGVYDILDSSSTSLSGNTVKINGVSKTFLSEHQSLANYVTLNGTQSISGQKTFSNKIVSSYLSGTWVNSLTSSALTISQHTGYGGILCAPTKSGNIALSTYPANDDYLYLGYGEKGRTTNSFLNTVRWNAKDNLLYVGSGRVLTTGDSYINSIQFSEYGKILVKGNGVTDTYLDFSHEHSFSELLDKPNTLDGYGISVLDSMFASVAAGKVVHAISWSGYNTGSFDGSSAKSFVIPNNTNQLTNGAGFITASASITGNAATSTLATYVKDSTNGSKISVTYAKAGQSSTSWLASWNGYELGAISPANINVGSSTKLKTARNIFGHSFDGSSDVSGDLSCDDIIMKTANQPCIYVNSKADANLLFDTYLQSSSRIVRIGYGAGTLVLAAGQKGRWEIKSDSSYCDTKFTANGQIQANGNILATGGITAYSTSDVRLKKNVRKVSCVQIIKELGPVYEFDYKRTGVHSIGLIAQNVQHGKLADIVGQDDEGFLKLNYWSPKLISLALGAVVQVDDKVARLRLRIKQLESRVKELELNNKNINN